MPSTTGAGPRTTATGPDGHVYRVGDRVRCPTHSKGTVWDSGWIEAFTEDGAAAFLTHGAPPHDFWALRGSGTPVPLRDLRPY
jgi:hypothetical protein